jgi:hypothetical protein
VYKIQSQDRPEIYVSICCDSQVAVKALQAAKISPLVHQCQQALNVISTWHTVGLYWVPGHARVRGNEISDKFARGGSIQKCIGPEPSLLVSRQNIRNKIKCWMDNQHLPMWWGPCSNQRQARKLVWALAQLQRPHYCSLIGHNQGLSLAFLLDITPSEDIFM